MPLSVMLGLVGGETNSGTSSIEILLRVPQNQYSSPCWTVPAKTRCDASKDIRKGDLVIALDWSILPPNNLVGSEWDRPDYDVHIYLGHNDESIVCTSSTAVSF